MRNQYNDLLKQVKIQYYKRQITEAGKDLRKLYCILNDLTGYTSKKSLPDGFSEQELANLFLGFFKDKIDNIINTFSGITIPEIENNIPEMCAHNTRLTQFQTIQEQELIEIMSKMKKTNCILDPMPISDISNAANFTDMVKRILRIINVIISTCRIPNSEKVAAITPGLKGSLDPQSLSSYRPVSNLSYLSKNNRKMLFLGN